MTRRLEERGIPLTMYNAFDTVSGGCHDALHILSKAELGKHLDEALRDTSPARDPVTIGDPSATEPERPLHRPPPALDIDLVGELARNGKAAREDRPATPEQDADLQRGGWRLALAPTDTRQQSAPSPVERKYQSGDAEQRALSDAVSDLDSRD